MVVKPTLFLRLVPFTVHHLKSRDSFRLLDKVMLLSFSYIIEGNEEILKLRRCGLDMSGSSALTHQSPDEYDLRRSHASSHLVAPELIWRLERQTWALNTDRQ